MRKRHMKDEHQIIPKEEKEVKEEEAAGQVSVDDREDLAAEFQEMNNKYLRLYAEFENYKKRVNKDKEEIIKYGNENLLYELLPVIDNLEMALKHGSNDVSSGLIQGVEITRKELKKTLERFGLTEIEAYGQPFDPLFHHAMSRVENDDVDDNVVVEEFRKGYLLKEKVLRPSLVAVSKKKAGSNKNEEETEIAINNIIEEES